MRQQCAGCLFQLLGRAGGVRDQQQGLEVIPLLRQCLLAQPVRLFRHAAPELNGAEP